MTSTRRDFLQYSLAAGTMAMTGLGAASLRSTGRAAKPMKLLILGGTGFLGPHIVERAQARGHVMTLFNRGRSNTHLFPDLEKLVGDRNGDLTALEGRTWDAVIDTSGYVPPQVDASAGLLADAVRQYVFISTISVYSTYPKPGMTEDDPVGTLPAPIENPTMQDVTATTYGPFKALCEQAAEKAMPGRVTNIRPGLICGPRDNTDRFTYWPVRLARGGETLAPGDGFDRVQFIDARDLAAFVIHCLEQGTTGVFNTNGPAEPLTVKEMLAGIAEGVEAKPKFVWVPSDFLSQQGVNGWQHMPVWIPAEGDYLGFAMLDLSRALGAGLTLRPVSETARDTLAWFNTLADDRKARLLEGRSAGLSAEREAEVLSAWKNREKTPAGG